MNQQVKILLEIIESTRSMTKFYLKKLSFVDPLRDLEIGDKKLHGINWTVCHLMWAENFLLIESTGKEGMNFPWFEKVSIGSDYTISSELPPYSITFEAFNNLHKQAIEAIEKLTDEDLIKKASIILPFAKDTTIKDCIIHFIRHEGIHTGHLSWLAKLNDTRVV